MRLKLKCWTKNWTSSKTNPETCRSPNSGTSRPSIQDLSQFSKWIRKHSSSSNSSLKLALTSMKTLMCMTSLSTSRRRTFSIISCFIDANLSRVKNLRFKLAARRCLRKTKCWVNKWAFQCWVSVLWILGWCSRLSKKIEPTKEELKLTKTCDLKFAI